MFHTPKPTVSEKPRPVLNKLATHQTFVFNQDATLPLENNKQRFLNAPIQNNQHVNVLIGSTYMKTGGYEHEAAVLDSAYSAYLYDGKQIVGQVIGVADGFGGHFDTQEDVYIAHASRVAVEHACSELAKYNQPEELSDEAIKTIAKNTGKMVFEFSIGQTSTLACGRVFRTRDNQFVFVGFGVGDSTIIGWNPATKEYITIVPGMHIGQSPAPIHNYRAEELRIYRLTLSEETLLIAMTDGAFETFTVRKQYSNLKQRFLLEPDKATIRSIFASLTIKNHSSDFAHAIISKEIENLNRAPLNAKGVKGDDITILVARISQTAFTAAHNRLLKLDQYLMEALAQTNIYSTTKLMPDYAAAALALDTIIAQLCCTEDYISIIRGLIAKSLITLSCHDNNQIQLSQMFRTGYRVRAMEYGLEVVSILRNLTPEILNNFQYRIPFSIELKKFLNTMLGVSKIVQSLQGIEGENKMPYQEYPVVITAAIEYFENLTEGMDLSDGNNHTDNNRVMSNNCLNI